MAHGPSSNLKDPPSSGLTPIREDGAQPSGGGAAGPAPEGDQRCGALAVRHGLITEQDLQQALARQRDLRGERRYRPVGAILVEMGKLTTDQLERLLYKQREAWEGNRLLNRYRLIEKIGEGGMGAVWKAIHEDVGNTVAIKLLPRAVVGDRRILERFQGELRALSILSHTNIVQAFDAGEADGQPFFVMPFMDGASLGQVLRKCGAIGARTALSITLQVLRGLQHAHEHAIIHRDLKPDNIYISNDGTVKILDLGLTKLMEDSGNPGDSASNGLIVGTPHHMSPEQILGDPNIDGRSDIYSLGSTLFQMVCGRVPFPGSSVAAVLRGKLDQAAPDPKEQMPTLSNGVRKLILRMMARKASERPADCRSLELEVEALLDGKPISGSNLAPGSIALGLSERGSCPNEILGPRNPLKDFQESTAKLVRSDLQPDPATTTVMPMLAAQELEPEARPKVDPAHEESPSSPHKTRRIEGRDLPGGKPEERPPGQSPSTTMAFLVDPALRKAGLRAILDKDALPNESQEPPALPAGDEAKSQPEKTESPVRTPATPKPGLSLGGQLLAAILLVILTTLLTVAAIRYLEGSRPAPVAPGTPK